MLLEAQGEAMACINQTPQFECAQWPSLGIDGALEVNAASKTVQLGEFVCVR